MSRRRRPEDPGPTQPLQGFPAIRFHKAVLAWYREHGRVLPWRETRDPYRIWVSEIMLQQTQVATVIPYYHRFIKAFPSVEALARAPLQRVLKLWEGLGYYARARNLHQAAKEVVNRWAGRIPEQIDLLQGLPGIGRSTAGAIVSFAYGKPAPILDGNVKRLLVRLFCLEDPPNRPAALKRLWDLSEALLPAACLPEHDPAAYNQALMDLGATVCTAREPDCQRCPVGHFCQALERGLQQRLPARSHRGPLPREEISIAVIQDRNRIFLYRRPDQGLWGGLWSLPESPFVHTPHALKEQLLRDWGLEVASVQPLSRYRHTFTHKQVTYHVYRCRYRSGRPRSPGEHCWAERNRLSHLALPTAIHRILATAREQGVLYPDLDLRESLPRAAEPAV